MTRRFPTRLWIQLAPLWLAALLAAQLGCSTIRLVSPYDENLDRGTSEVHTRIVAFLGKVSLLAGKPEGAYEANKGFYPEVAGQVSTLRLRANAAPKNEVTVKLFDELLGNIERLRALHESGKDAGLPPALAGPAQSAIDVNCAGILKLELAKKRGE